MKRTDLSTGLPELDQLLRGLIAGDNLVWRVAHVEDYRAFALPYCAHGIKSGRAVVYLRYANHPPIVEPDAFPGGLTTCELDPRQGFESFLDAVHDAIEQTPRDAYYVFDSLSSLAETWYSDQMLCNFFMLTCPYLYDRGDIAYFALMRDRHSNEAVMPIRETAQVMADVYRHEGELYLRPLKTQQRFSPTMHMLHRWRDEAFQPISESHTITRVLRDTPPSAVGCAVRPLDAWNKAFLQAQDLLLGPPEGLHSEYASLLFEQLLRMAISRDTRILSLARTYLTLEDMLDIGRRTIGTGMIGGKAVGMLLAQAILKHHDPVRWQKRLEGHDSFYIGADMFYTFLVRNGCWWIRRRQKTARDFLEGAQQIRRRILTGVFPQEMEAELTRMLDYFGCSPIIVRSSSVLEDNFGNAFAGKYESVFCPNQGSFQQRLEDFKSAVRSVYASAMSEDALAYRKCRGLLDKEEQMGLLVQRVSGVQREDLFFPDAAGVGFSYNPYVWHEDIEPEAGLVRLVFGLGTRAVNRSDDDYTRIIALNAPMQTPEGDRAMARKYIQHKVDLLDLNANHLGTMDFMQLLKRRQDGQAWKCLFLAASDPEVEHQIRQTGRQIVSPLFINFDKFLRSTDFVDDMNTALSTLQRAYENPVDIEFTLNLVNETDYRINLVQCRPLQVKGNAAMEDMPENIPDERILLRSSGPIIGQPRSDSVERFIFVNPDTYGQLPVQERHRVARLIGKLTHCEDACRHAHVMLLGPGRWGTSTPSLGVPITFAEIENVASLCEIVAMREDLVPDVSMGTHFFSELVEMEMLYLALFPEKPDSLIAARFFLEGPNHLVEALPEAAPYAHVIRYLTPEDAAPGARAHIYADPIKQQFLCFIESV
ncbi:MAG TPA: PEP/pyruvate-binding domain-containing protein [Candidatus Hydrogenedentes bacterium]|nr:pyruvate, phosphate dikinase [Candidatus Hydrogenedentota bacterium]HOC68261.1 PEP/pyruvate-binding domain-containing protein [Candidatus Hydrogenedentota bacterium]